MGNLRRYFKVRLDGDVNNSMDHRDADPANADLVSSLVHTAEPWHLPVFDLDFDCELKPSSSPGKYHLFLNRPVPWSKYVKVLEAMAEAGLLERGWVDAAKRQGYAVLRAKPNKGTPQDNVAKVRRSGY